MSEKKKHEKTCKRKCNKYTIDCSSDSYDSYDSDEDNKYSTTNKAKCYRCGRNGHYANK